MPDSNDNSKAEETSGNSGNSSNNDKDGTSFRKLFKKIVEEYPRIAAMVIAVITGLVALWEGYGQWWFGFRVSPWVLITLAVALNVFWLMVFCGYYRESHPAWKKEGQKEQEEKVKLRSLSLNVLLMIALPALVLGILGGYFAMKWRLTEKIVILVEPFEGDEEDPYYLARAVKSGIERNIRLSDRHRFRVALGKKHEGVKSKDVPLEELALKHRADMVISGWHTKTNKDSEVLISANFYVVRVPQDLPAVFRRQESDYPRSLIFSKKEIENFKVNFTLEGLMEYESILMIGAGAYASGEWKTAEHYFSKALGLIKQGQECAGSDRTREAKCLSNSMRKLVEQRRKKVYSEKYIEGDKALLKLYIGHCLFNQGRLDCAIDCYHEAVKQGEEIPESDMRYSEILTNAYLGRGIAYREKNAFDLAAHDFNRLGGYSLFSDGFEPRRTYESRYPVKGSVGLKVYAKRFYERGEEYLKNREHAHAQSELETSVKMLRALSNEVFTHKLEQECSFLLAESLVRLGEVHSRQALPETWNDKHTEDAIKYLNEASNIIKELKQDEADVNDVFDDNDLKGLHADCLRHLGDVHRLTDRKDKVEKAVKYHEDANNLLIGINEVNKAAGEQTRIGETYRRLNDLGPDPNWLKKAIDAFECSIRMYEGVEYLKSLDPNLTDPNLDLKKIKCKLLRKSETKIITHHLAFSLTNLAEVQINRSDSNQSDLKIACKQLEYAVECYEKAVKKLHVDKDPNWIKRIKEEERNMSLKDDLAWCLTLYGYALTKKGPKDPNDPNDHNEHYRNVKKILVKAKNRFRELRDVDESHRVLSLFALSVSQVELANGKKQEPKEARETFKDACLLLRRLTREQKKVWYVDYVYDIIENLPQRGLHFDTDNDCKNLKKIKTWLVAETVREGRRALEKIIESADNKLKKTGEAGS